MENQVIEYLSQEFDRICQERHEVGAQEYGAKKFLEPQTDLVKMIGEELTDMANYARYLYIRVRMMELNASQAGLSFLQEPQGESVNVGPEAFTPAGGTN